MGDGPSIDQGTLLHAQGITGGASNNAGSQDVKILAGLLNKYLLPNSQGIDTYNTQGFLNGSINPFARGQGTNFGFAAIWNSIVKNLTREATPVHGNEIGSTVAAAAPVEPPSNNASFSDLVGNAGSMGSYSVAEVAGASAPIGPRMGDSMFIG